MSGGAAQHFLCFGIVTFHTAVFMCTTSLTFSNSTSCPTQLYLCVLCGSENKQRLFPYTAITDWVLGAFTKLGKTTISFGMSVRLSVPNNSTPGGRIFIQFYISILFENPFRKSKSHYNLTTITGTSHADRHTFLIISRLIRLIMTNISDKFVEKIKTHILCSVTFS